MNFGYTFGVRESINRMITVDMHFLPVGSSYTKRAIIVAKGDLPSFKAQHLRGVVHPNPVRLVAADEDLIARLNTKK